MKIFRATRFYFITQRFGEHPELYKKYNLPGHNGWDFSVFPCSEGFADTDTNKCAEIYCDLDIKAKIIGIAYGLSEGLGITAITEDQDGIFMHRWWHFNSINPNLKVGDNLESGDLLGWGGSTGYASGPHLHRDLHPMIKNEQGFYLRKNPNDPYRGAVDLTPWINPDIFILDLLEKQVKTISILQKMLELYKKVVKLIQQK